MDRQLRVAVIGSETRHIDKPPLTYTVYRTSVNYQGFCYHRLIRFRHFRSFAKHLNLASNASCISVKLPPRRWSRKASLRPETVEARQVLLNEFMQQVSTRPLTPHSEEQLLKLLQVGPFAPQEEEDRVINSRLSFKQHSVTMTEPISVNHSLQSEPSHQLPVTSEKQPQDSLTDDEEESCTAEQVHNVPKSLLVQRQDSQGSSNPASDDADIRADRSISAPLNPVLQEKTRPVSMSLTSQNMKQVLSNETELLSLKEGGRDSTRSSSDLASTPTCHFLDQIKQCNAKIEDIMDSSRKLEVLIREK